MHSFVRPDTHIALRLPSGILKVIEVKPNTSINLGKYGTFPASLLFGRPYYLTFEVLDKDDGRSSPELRVVPAAELHAEALGEEHGASEARDESGETGGAEFDIVGDDGAVIMRSNRLTIDDPARQTLSMEEIEELKKAGTGSGKEIIAKIMASHQAIDEKTSFSLAKYTLRKARKYLKRFTVLPLDVGTLTEYVTEKEAYKVLELREESLGLIGSWANVHHGGASRLLTAEDEISQIGGGRWLVVDDTGGLIVAAMAEKMGILYPTEEGDEESEEDNATTESQTETQQDQPISQDRERSKETSINGITNEDTAAMKDADTVMTDAPSEPTNDIPTASTPAPNATTPSTISNGPSKPRKHHQHTSQMTARTNTLTVLHPNSQPNLAFLKYFSFDSGAPAPSHPLYHHLRSLSWLSLISPHEDPAYDEPELLSEEALASLKSSKRGNYYKKRRRWEKTSMVVDETRRGGFDGLVVASTMEPASVLKHLVPLVRGGGRIVVYSSSVESLVELCDLYSKERRTAWVTRQYEAQHRKPNGKVKHEANEEEDEEERTNGELDGEDDEDFPVTPTLLLAPSLQTARARHWQVLPGRTHPLMTSRGGAEGYLFTATRVLPAEGKVEARGTFRGKKRKTGTEATVPT